MENGTSEEENREILAAAIHDKGILLQILLARECGSATASNHTISPELIQRLLALKEPAPAPVSLPIQRPSSNVLKKSSKARWLAFVSIAAVFLLALGWGMLKWANQGGNEKIENRKENIAETENGKGRSNIPSDSDETGRQGSSRGGSLVQGLEMTNQPSPDVVQVDPSRSPLVENRGIAPSQNIVTPNELPSLPQTSLANKPSIANVSAWIDRVEWNQIQGILLERESSSQVGWLVRTQPARNKDREATESPKSQTSVFHWLTPEGSYARASVGTSSELILGANSHVRVGTEPQKTTITMEEGALAIKNIPEGQYLEIRVEPIDESNATTTSIPFETRKITSVYARVENRRLEVFVIGGELESDRTLFGEKSSLRWKRTIWRFRTAPYASRMGRENPE